MRGSKTAALNDLPDQPYPLSIGRYGVLAGAGGAHSSRPAVMASIRKIENVAVS
jgi:hypothetical protein